MTVGKQDEERDCQHASMRNRAYISSRQSDHPSKTRKLIIGSSMAEIAIERSDLLSGFGNTDGHAAIQFSHEDYRMWETACTVEAEISAEELAIVLKVADAVGDKHRSRWLEKLAKQAIATDWQSSKASDAMLSALISLPPHLLSQVFEDKRFDLNKVMSTFPPPVHAPAVLGATIQNQGKLEHLLSSTPTLLHVLSTSPLPPGLLTELVISRMHVRDSRGRRRYESDGLKTPPAIPNSTGALLAPAAAAHPSLTKITFSLCHPPLPPPWLRSFASSLQHSTLPSLQHLQMAVQAHPFGCAETIGCLSHLPALTRLHIHFHLPAPEAAACASGILSSYARLPAMHASLPRLEILWYSDGEIAVNKHGWKFKDSELPSCTAAFFPYIKAAALTHLDLKTTAANLSCEDLVACAARFPSLKCVDVSAFVSLESQFDHDGDLEFHFPPSHTLALESVGISSRCPVSTAAIGAAFVVQTRGSLTSLDVSVSTSSEDQYFDGHCVKGTPVMVTSAWSSFRGALERCTRLESLDLGLVCPMEDDCGRDSRLETALENLSMLTHLALVARINPVALDSIVVLNGGMLGQALSKLAALQTLEVWCVVDRTVIEVESIEPMLHGCAFLKQLTSLRLCMGQQVAPSHNLLINLLHQLPALKRCALFTDDWQGFDDYDSTDDLLSNAFSNVNFEIN